MNNHILRYVIAVAEEGNFTRAAQKLYVSQPTLSQGIRTLEQQLGTTLFDRSVTPVALTYAGEEFLAWARQAVLSEAEIVRRLADISRSRRRKLVVGISPHRSLILLPGVLRRFYQENRECKVILLEQRSSEYLRSFEEGKMDLLVDCPHPDTATYGSITLREEKLLLAVPDSCGGDAAREEDGGRMDREALRGKPVIMLSEAQHLGKIWRGVFRTAGFSPETVFECQSIMMAYAMACQGLGITLLPDTVIRFMPPAPGMRYYELDGQPLSRTMAVLFHRNQYLSHDARRFVEILGEIVNGR